MEKKDTVLAMGCAQLAHTLVIAAINNTTQPGAGGEEILNGDHKKEWLQALRKAQGWVDDDKRWAVPAPRNGVLYELRMCEKGLKMLPDENTEGADVAKEVLTELIASAASLSVSASLLSSLSKAACFMVEQGIAMAEGQIFKLALNFEVIPLNFESAAQTGTLNEVQLMTQLKHWEGVVEMHGKNWEIMYAWVKCLGKLASVRALLNS